MANGMGLMGEDGPEAVMPLARTDNGKLGVYISGDGGGSRNLYTVNVDARGSSDPAATSAAVHQAVDEALSARIPGIVQASADLARRQVVDTYQRRGNSFD
jgi:phage-related minor tail protein